MSHEGPVNEAAVRVEFPGPNEAYAEELMERYRRDPATVPPADRRFLAAWRPRPVPVGEVAAGVAEIVRTVHALRTSGYRQSAAVGVAVAEDPVPDAWAAVPVEAVNPWLEEPLRPAPHSGAAVAALRQAYLGRLSVQVEHLRDETLRRWWWRQAEAPRPGLPPETARAVLERLTQVEQFEQLFQTRFPGQKRFSVEGVDMVVPMLEALVAEAGAAGYRDVVIGMAHRGRLNVLAHVLDKPYTALIQEMQMVSTRTDDPITVPPGWTGDAKYHLGHVREADPATGRPRMVLLNNPSHLEFVNPVILGVARALAEERDRPGPPGLAPERVLPIAVHGDAAFMGEGVVAESLNLQDLPAYHVGGTVHLLLDNGLGFTTDPEEGRSTPLAGDLARAFDVPIIHCDADDPPACLTAVQWAFQYRHTFARDVMVVLHGYRRWGHNEGDEPAFTQPLMYAAIRRRPTVRALWADALVRSGVVTAEDADALVQAARKTLKAALDKATEAPLAPQPAGIGKRAPAASPRIWTAEALTELGLALYRPPEGFRLHPRLSRLVERTRQALEAGEPLEWGAVESLAFATLTAEGIAVRLAGQDTERGTFSQRHAVWHDVETGERYVPLAHLDQARAAITVANSPLSELAAMGFEYGYDAAAVGALVLWEAQYGDFANAAQVIIDQFLAAGYAKWAQRSGLVLLLPHGYDGQGPEHSSARLERYLELYADSNLRIVFPSSAQQYFHVLREQAYQAEPTPLVVLTGKSLFRHPRARARVSDLAGSRFEPVRVLYEEAPDAVTHVIAGTGKLLTDLLDRPVPGSGAAVVSVEQLAPWPEAALAAVLGRYPRLSEIRWVQEEPENMGAWRFVQGVWTLPSGVALRYVGRPASGSPSEGFVPLFRAMQSRIEAQAWAPTGNGGTRTLLSAGSRREG